VKTQRVEKGIVRRDLDAGRDPESMVK